MSHEGATTLDDFQYWVADMDDALERFMDRLPEHTRRSLDYSPNSLDVLESWLLDRFASFEEARSPPASDALDGAARYLGETLRKNLGGHWTINLTDRKDAFYGLPVLRGFPGERSPLCPLSLAIASTHRRTGNSLRRVLENAARPSSA